ncbi:hypothetical protein BGX29_003953, partial [Mortierella sp. GBA35]
MIGSHESFIPWEERDIIDTAMTQEAERYMFHLLRMTSFNGAPTYTPAGALTHILNKVAVWLKVPLLFKSLTSSDPISPMSVAPREPFAEMFAAASDMDDTTPADTITPTAYPDIPTVSLLELTRQVRKTTSATTTTDSRALGGLPIAGTSFSLPISAKRAIPPPQIQAAVELVADKIAQVTKKESSLARNTPAITMITTSVSHTSATSTLATTISATITDSGALGASPAAAGTGLSVLPPWVKKAHPPPQIKEPVKPVAQKIAYTTKKKSSRLACNTPAITSGITTSGITTSATTTDSEVLRGSPIPGTSCSVPPTSYKKALPPTPVKEPVQPIAHKVAQVTKKESSELANNTPTTTMTTTSASITSGTTTSASITSARTTTDSEALGGSLDAGAAFSPPFTSAKKALPPPPIEKSIQPVEHKIAQVTKQKSSKLAGNNSVITMTTSPAPTTSATTTDAGALGGSPMAGTAFSFSPTLVMNTLPPPPFEKPVEHVAHKIAQATKKESNELGDNTPATTM